MPVCCYQCPLNESTLNANAINFTSNNCLIDEEDDGTLKRCDSMNDVCASGTMSKSLRKKWSLVLNIIKFIMSK